MCPPSPAVATELAAGDTQRLSLTTWAVAASSCTQTVRTASISTSASSRVDFSMVSGGAKRMTWW